MIVYNACPKCKKKNKLKNSILCIQCSNSERSKGKTWIEIYGKNKALQLSIKQSDRLKQNNPSKLLSARKKNSEWHKGKSPGNKGKKYEEYMSLEKVKEIKIKLHNRKYKHTEKTKEKIRKAVMGKNNPFFGKHHKKESIEQMKQKQYMHHELYSNNMKNNWKKYRNIFLENVRQNGINNIMPLQDTAIKISMQKELTNRGIIFIKHKQIFNIYRCDIFIKPNIIIECDGDYWHNYPIGTEKDKLRNSLLQQKGFLVLRYWEHEIKNNIRDIVNEIEEILCCTDNKKAYNKVI